MEQCRDFQRLPIPTQHNVPQTQARSLNSRICASQHFMWVRSPCAAVEAIERGTDQITNASLGRRGRSGTELQVGQQLSISYNSPKVSKRYSFGYDLTAFILPPASRVHSCPYGSGAIEVAMSCNPSLTSSVRFTNAPPSTATSPAMVLCASATRSNA